MTVLSIGPTPGERFKQLMDSIPVRVGIAAGVILSLLGTAAVTLEQRDLTTCLASYNDRSNANQQARAALVSQDREALDAWIVRLDEALKRPPAESGTEIRNAITDYRLTRAGIDGERKSAPIPDPPSIICG